MAATQLLGVTQEEWDNMNRRQKRNAKWKYVKQNLVPSLIGGSLGAAVFAKDPNLRKIGTAISIIGVTAGISGADPTDLKGSYEVLKKNGATVLNLIKGLTNDQKVGLKILGEQSSVKSLLSFKSAGIAQIVTDTNEEYEINYSNGTELTGAILAAKGVPKLTASKVTDIVNQQPLAKKAKVIPFLQKLWKGVYTNLPQIIQTMQEEKLDIPTDFDPTSDGWDGTADLPTDTTPDPKDPKDPKTEEPKIFGIPQNTALGGLALGTLGYAFLNK